MRGRERPIDRQTETEKGRQKGEEGEREWHKGRGILV